MKTALRRCNALARCIALLLAFLPAGCYCALLNVWIYEPVDDRASSVALTVAIGAYNVGNSDLFYAQQQITNAGVLWSWQTATIDTNNTGPSASSASVPTLFQAPTNLTVTATYSNVTSHGVNVTVVCPKETTTAGSPICCTPPDCLGDPTGTNYVWGGTFTYTYTYVDQDGNTNVTGAGRYWKEVNPVYYPTSNCPGLGKGQVIYTVEPVQISFWNQYVNDEIAECGPQPPPSVDCTIYGQITALLGATLNGTFPCPYTNVWNIAVTHPASGTIITAIDNSVTDDYCQW